VHSRVGLLVTFTLTLGCRAGVVESPDEFVPPATTHAMTDPATHPAILHGELQRTIEAVLPAVDELEAERREALDALAAFVIEARAAERPAALIFICTHNSRRSHISQLWAAAAAAYFGVDEVQTYSGGTEATAFNPRAVAAMRRAGFAITDGPEDDNPRYRVELGPAIAPLTAFSKTWDDEANPREDFAAVMTCSQADESCPFVRGASMRISLPYDDPKLADDSADEAAVYDQRTMQIAVEMLYVFREVARAAQR
jgi:arsenate reductase (thioredoxin)